MSAALDVRGAVRRAILRAAATEPVLERDLPGLIGYGAAECSVGMGWLVEMRHLAPAGLRWRLTDAGRAQAREWGIDLPEPEPAPVEATPRRPRRAAARPRPPRPAAPAGITRRHRR